MKIVLFCEQKYAINILQPLEIEAHKEGGHSVIWYVHAKNIPDFPLKNYCCPLKLFEPKN